MVYFFIFSILGTIGATVLGALLSSVLIKAKKEVLCFLQNLTVGGIVALIFIELFEEAIENFTLSNERSGICYSLLIILATSLLFFLLHEGVHLISHHHDEDKEDNEDYHDHGHTIDAFKEKTTLIASFVFLGAIFVHNIPEGLSLGVSFLKLNEVGIPINGIIMSFILFIHNFLIGFLMMSSFLNANKTKSFSFLMTFLSSLPAFVLSIVGYFISSIDLGNLFKGVIYSVSVGSLLYVLFIELVPQTANEYKSRYTFIYIIFGIVLSALLILLGE